MGLTSKDNTEAERRCYPAEPFELVYSIRPCDSSRYSEERRTLVVDRVYVGREDTDTVSAAEIRFPEGDEATSRFHGVVFITSDGEVRYQDLGSENGSFVGDERVQSCALRPGVVLRLGRAAGRSTLKVLAVSPPPEDTGSLWGDARFHGLRGRSLPLRRAFAESSRLARLDTCPRAFVVRGPPGSGKKAFLWELFRAWGMPLHRVPYVDGRWVLGARADEFRRLLLEQRQVVIIGHIEGLPVDEQRVLADLLRERKQGHPSLVLLVEEPTLPPCEPQLIERNLMKTLRTMPYLSLPGVAQCGPTEIEEFAHHFLEKYKKESPPGGRFCVQNCEFSTRCLAAVCEAVWHGGWRQLRAAVEFAAFSVALDGRETIEETDLRAGFSESSLPLELLFEMPLAEAEEVFRRAYLMWKVRKWAGNMKWVADEVDFTRRGLLKAAKMSGIHDGEQVVLPAIERWQVSEPRYLREERRLRVSVPSSVMWLRECVRQGLDTEIARATLLELLDAHTAAKIERHVEWQIQRGRCDPVKLKKTLG